MKHFIEKKNLYIGNEGTRMQCVLYVRGAAWFAAPCALTAPLVVAGLLGRQQCLCLREFCLPLQNRHITDRDTTNQVIPR